MKSPLYSHKVLSFFRHISKFIRDIKKYLIQKRLIQKNVYFRYEKLFNTKSFIIKLYLFMYVINIF